MTNQAAKINRIIIFGRYPKPGNTKTRLIKELGKAGAAHLQKRLTDKTVSTVKTASNNLKAETQFCFEGGDINRIRRWLGSSIIFTPQGSGDLGDRMFEAFRKGFYDGCKKILLVGTDVPGLTPVHFEKAYTALIENDIVLGPSKDGGYWLIGLKKPVNVFKGIHWGEKTVLQDTIDIAKKMGLSIHLLDPLMDIDNIEDLRYWKGKDFSPKPYISVIIPTFNEENNIEKTIERAKNKDAEIIVADGGSTDGTVEIAIRSGAKVKICPLGRASQQNHGASSAKGEILLFLHADTLLPKDYVDHVFEILMDKMNSVGAFRFKTDFDHPMMNLITFMINIRSRYLNLPYGDQAIFMKKKIFDDAHGFPEVPIAEDLFMVRKLAKFGKVKMTPVSITTSARRWRQFGLFRNTLVNQIVFTGCCLGVSPEVLFRVHCKLYPVSKSTNSLVSIQKW